MIRYRVAKNMNGGGWHVIRHRGLERRTVSIWPGQASALEAALELAGLAKPVEATC